MSDTIYNLVWSIGSVLAVPTLLLLLLKKYVPIVGNPLWDQYVHLLGRLLTAPIRVIQFLVREAMGRRQ